MSQDEIRAVFLSNYMYDMEWMLGALPVLRRVPVVLVHGERESRKEYIRVRFIYPFSCYCFLFVCLFFFLVWLTLSAVALCNVPQHHRLFAARPSLRHSPQQNDICVSRRPRHHLHSHR